MISSFKNLTGQSVGSTLPVLQNFPSGQVRDKVTFGQYCPPGQGSGRLGPAQMYFLPFSSYTGAPFEGEQQYPACLQRYGDVPYKFG